MNARYRLVSFLFEFTTSTASVIIPVVAAVIVVVAAAPAIAATRLEFLIAFVAVVVVSSALLPFPVLIRAEALDIGCIGELQLSAGEVGQLALDGVVMDGLLMPVVVGEFHIISDGVGKAAAFVGVLFRQCFVDHDLQVLSEMGEPGIALWIFQWFWPGPQGLPGRDRIGGSYFQFEI